MWWGTASIVVTAAAQRAPADRRLDMRNLNIHRKIHANVILSAWRTAPESAAKALMVQFALSLKSIGRSN